MKTPILKGINIGDERCTLIYSDGDRFDITRDTYNRSFGAIINCSSMFGKDAVRREFAIE